MLAVREESQRDSRVQRRDPGHDRQVVVDIGASTLPDGEDVNGFLEALEEGSVFR
jgi:hypothetical protein